jgi:hypothetical protein
MFLCLDIQFKTIVCRFIIFTYIIGREKNRSSYEDFERLFFSYCWILFYGAWNSAYEGYNCYAYAIGYDDWIDPGVFDWVDKGNDSATYEYNDKANIYTIAGLVEADLIARGCTVNVVSTTLPSAVVSDHTNLICVRKDTDGHYEQYQNYYFYIYDYHFMKLCENIH